MVADVVDGDVAPLDRAHRRVDGLVGRHRLEAADVPAADVVVVRRVAVGAEQRRAVVRRQQHRALEAGDVVQRPRRDREHRRADEHDAAAAPGGGGRPPATTPGRRTRRRTAAISLRVERAEPDERTRARPPAPSPGRRSKSRATSRATATIRHGQRLRHHERVVDPQVRVDGGDRRGDEPDPRPGQAPADEPDDGDGGDAEQRRGEALPRDVVAAAEAPRREVQRRQRAVLGARQLGQRLAEPVALAVPPGLDAVVQRVVEQQLVVDLDGEQVAQPPHRADRRDDRQADAERPDVTSMPGLAARSGLARSRALGELAEVADHVRHGERQQPSIRGVDQALRQQAVALRRHPAGLVVAERWRRRRPTTRSPSPRSAMACM